MDGRASVLIVDRSEESREVLRTVLGRKGLRVLEASRPDQGLRLAQSCQPDVVVLDPEFAHGAAREVTRAFVEQSSGTPCQLLVLGTTRRNHPTVSGGQFVAKPYHYAQLIRKIEALVNPIPRPDKHDAI
jgi:DNA-binding response OmpR family regulator